jgi:hypothetical protein
MLGETHEDFLIQIEVLVLVVAEQEGDGLNRLEAMAI